MSQWLQWLWVSSTRKNPTQLSNCHIIAVCLQMFILHIWMFVLQVWPISIPQKSDQPAMSRSCSSSPSLDQVGTWTSGLLTADPAKCIKTAVTSMLHQCSIIVINLQYLWLLHTFTIFYYKFIQHVTMFHPFHLPFIYLSSLPTQCILGSKTLGRPRVQRLRGEHRKVRTRHGWPIMNAWRCRHDRRFQRHPSWCKRSHQLESFKNSEFSCNSTQIGQWFFHSSSMVFSWCK